MQEQEEENLEFEVQCIDLFCLRVLSLLICRGKACDKAAYLASSANQNQNEELSWDNVRLTRALKLMVYITSILPQKFMSTHEGQENYYRILNPNSTFVVKRNEGKKIKKILNAREEDMPQEGFLWTPEQIEGKEMLFEFVFEKFFEDQYLGKIFSENEGNVLNQDFVDKFEKSNSKSNLTSSVNMNWIFSPCQMNFVLKQHYEQAERIEAFINEKMQKYEEWGCTVSEDTASNSNRSTQESV